MKQAKVFLNNKLIPYQRSFYIHPLIGYYLFVNILIDMYLLCLFSKC